MAAAGAQQAAGGGRWAVAGCCDGASGDGSCAGAVPGLPPAPPPECVCGLHVHEVRGFASSGARVRGHLAASRHHVGRGRERRPCHIAHRTRLAQAAPPCAILITQATVDRGTWVTSTRPRQPDPSFRRSAPRPARPVRRERAQLSVRSIENAFSCSSAVADAAVLQGGPVVPQLQHQEVSPGCQVARSTAHSGSVALGACRASCTRRPAHTRARVRPLRVLRAACCARPTADDSLPNPSRPPVITTTAPATWRARRARSRGSGRLQRRPRPRRGGRRQWQTSRRSNGRRRSTPCTAANSKPCW